MKRCPQCQFIYPDADTVCDFDQTLLTPVAESEIAALTDTPERPALADLAAAQSKRFEKRRNRRALPLAATLGLILGIAIFGVYIAVHRQMSPSPKAQTDAYATAPTVISSPIFPSPIVSSSDTASTATTVSTKIESAGALPQQSTAHSQSTNPVSPGTQSVVPTIDGRTVILLTAGGKVEADEVWRTKDGVWYRRNGVVTLLKKNRVKAILIEKKK